jgi:hypothetical protein
MAFGSTLAREEKFPEHVWRERAEGGASGADMRDGIPVRMTVRDIRQIDSWVIPG